MNRQMTMPISESMVKISIGRGISNSAMKGDVMEKKRPKVLQMPKAVPASTTGKMYGVDT